MRVAAVVFAMMLCAPGWAEEKEEAAVVAAVQRLFDAIEARDPAAANAVLLPSGSYVSVREKADEAVVASVPHPEFAARVAVDREPIREVMRGPKVLIHGRVATVWTPYEFHRGGKLSHCGVDSFNLVKTAEGWKIAGFVYNVEACPGR